MCFTCFRIVPFSDAKYYINMSRKWSMAFFASHIDAMDTVVCIDFKSKKNTVKKHHISSSSSSSSSWLRFVAKMATEIVSLRIYDPKLITGCSLFYLLLDFPVISQSLSTRHNFAIRQNFSTSACVLIYFPFIGIYCPLWYNDTSSTFFVWDVNFTSNLYSKWQSKRERKKKKEREKRIQTHTNPTHD